jgi:hypothetical protein
MEVPKVLNTVHVVYFDSDSSLPSRMYKDTVGVVHLSAGQAITSPPAYMERPVHKQTISGHSLYRLWEFWFVDSPKVRLRHFMMKKGVSQPTMVPQSNTLDRGICNNTNQTKGYVQQHGDEMENDTGANMLVPQALYVQPHVHHVPYYVPQQQYSLQQNFTQPHQYDPLPADSDQPLCGAETTEFEMQPPGNVFQEGNISQDDSTDIIMAFNLIPHEKVYYDEVNDTIKFNCNVNIEPQWQLTFNQGGADYAEWMPREDNNEIMQPGDVIAIIGQKGITKTILPHYAVSVISTKHSLCANLPERSMLPLGEVVAFKGRAPIKVIGKVKLNDQIVPSGRNDGTGIAKNYCKDKELQNHIVGQAWEASDDEDVKLIDCLIDLKSPDIGHIKSDFEDDLLSGPELQELIMHSLAYQEDFSTILDVHVIHPTAIFAELRALLKRLTNELSGLTIIVWVDTSALPGFIKDQFLREFGIIDSLSGGVINNEQEIVLLVEEWNREISFKGDSTEDFDKNLKDHSSVVLNLVSTYNTSKLDYPDNYTLIIGIDVPTKLYLGAKQQIHGASFLSLIMKYPITRMFKTTSKIQLYQVNSKVLQQSPKRHSSFDETWAKSALPHQNIPQGIRRGVLSRANHWELKSFSFPEKQEKVMVEHMECKPNGLRDALLFSLNNSSFLILGGFDLSNVLSTDAHKVVENSSGHIHSFFKIKDNLLQSDSLVLKSSTKNLVVLHKAKDGAYKVDKLTPSESFSSKSVGSIKVDGEPHALIEHDGFFYVITKETKSIRIYRFTAEFKDHDCSQSIAIPSIDHVSFITYEKILYLQINCVLFTLGTNGCEEKSKINPMIFIDGKGPHLIGIRLCNNKMAVCKINTRTFEEQVIAELLEVRPRKNFSCLTTGNNKYIIYGGQSLDEREILNDVFIVSLKPPDYLQIYTNAWVAKHKILSLPKKTRYRKYEQAAKRAVGNKDYTTAANIYEGLVRTIHSFDNYYGLGLCLLHSKSGSEVHHYRSRIELALVRASECIENIDQLMKVDMAKK